MQKSLSLVTLGGIRCAGPGTYFPAHRKADGTLVNARWIGRFFLNDFYIDGQGNRVDNNSVISVTCWNGKNAPAGKGLADRMAKYCAPGKEIAIALARINVYEGRVFPKHVDGVVAQPYQHADGTLVMVEKTSYVLDGSSVRFGNDSSKQLAAEAAAFTGEMNFMSRPADWQGAGTLGAKQWEGISSWRTAQCFDPQYTTYGYAKVGSVNGTPVASHATTTNTVQNNGTNIANNGQQNNAVNSPSGGNVAMTGDGAEDQAGAEFPSDPVNDDSGASGGPVSQY